ncbi:MAG: glycosyltransferase family 2 protein [Methylococcaceae bacterium]
MQVSIVTTLYKSEPYLTEFYQRISQCAQTITADYEIILVDDGSPDRALSLALDIQRSDAKVIVVELSRNFGHHEAGMTGLEYASGDYVFLIDCDLEEPPELLAEFWQAMIEQADIDMIYGVQRNRKGGWFEQLSGQFFYRLFNAVSDVKIPINVLTVRLMKHAVVQALLKYPEKHLLVAGIMALVGFNQQALMVVKSSKNQRSYNLSRQLNLLLNSLLSFSTKPSVWLLCSGLIMLLLALVSTFIMAFNGMFDSTLSLTQGKQTFLIINYCLGGLFFCSGFLGLLLVKVYEEVKRRPRVIVKRVYSNDSH